MLEKDKALLEFLLQAKLVANELQRVVNIFIQKWVISKKNNKDFYNIHDLFFIKLEVYLE